MYRSDFHNVALLILALWMGGCAPNQTGGEGYGGGDDLVIAVHKAQRSVTKAAEGVLLAKAQATSARGLNPGKYLGKFPPIAELCAAEGNGCLGSPTQCSEMANYNETQRAYLAKFILENESVLQHLRAWGQDPALVRVVPNPLELSGLEMDAMTERKNGGVAFFNHARNKNKIHTDLVALLIHEALHTFTPAGASETFDDTSPVLDDEGNVLFSRNFDFLSGVGTCLAVFVAAVEGPFGGLPEEFKDPDFEIPDEDGDGIPDYDPEDFPGLPEIPEGWEPGKPLRSRIVLPPGIFR